MIDTAFSMNLKSHMEHAKIKNPLLFYFIAIMAFAAIICAIYIAWKF